MKRSAFLLSIVLAASVSAPPPLPVAAQEQLGKTTSPPATISKEESERLLRVSSLIKRGERALIRKDYATARKSFEQALTKEPESLRAKVGLAQSLYGLGDYKEALAIADSVKEKLSNLDESVRALMFHNLLVSRAKILQELQNFEQAEKDLSQAIASGKGCADTYACRATAYDALGQADKAIGDLTKAIEMQPGNSDLRLRRALMYRAGGNNEAAGKDLDEAVKNDPSFVTWRASFNREQGKNDAAIEDYSQAIDLQSGNDKATQYFNRGVIYEDLDQHRSAIEDFTEASTINPNNAEYYVHRGTSFFGVSDFTHAIEDFNKAISLAPNNADYYFRRGNAYQENAEKEEAMADFNKAIELDSKNPMFFIKRADLHEEQGRTDLAIADLTNAIGIKDDVDFHYDRALAYISAGKFKQAIDDLSTTITRKPDFAAAYKNRAIARAKVGDGQEAVQDLRKSAELYQTEGDRHNCAEVNRLLQTMKIKS